MDVTNTTVDNKLYSFYFLLVFHIISWIIIIAYCIYKNNNYFISSEGVLINSIISFYFVLDIVFIGLISSMLNNDDEEDEYENYNTNKNIYKIYFIVLLILLVLSVCSVLSLVNSGRLKHLPFFKGLSTIIGIAIIIHFPIKEMIPFQF
jgi:hypothetical protein